MNTETHHWWQRIQWIDVLLVVIGVLLLVMMTMEWWLPHFGVE